MKKLILGLFLILGAVSFTMPNFINTTKLQKAGYTIIEDSETVLTIADTDVVDGDSILVASFYLSDMSPKELSDDFTTTGAVIEHAINFLKNCGEKIKFVCTIYATAPLIDEKYLRLGFEKLSNSNAKYAFSCTSMPFPIWRTFKITDNGRCEMFW